MSKTVKGRVQAVSDKQDNDYFGICIDDDWYNGPDSLNRDLQDAKIKLTVKSDSDDFIDIQKINVLEEANEDDATSGRDTSDSGNGRGDSNAGSNSSSRKNPKRANIMATAATKKAADIVDAEKYTNKGEYIDQVSTVASGLNSIMNNLYEENME